jgi:splicing factor 45
VHWDHAVVVCQTVRIFVAFKRQESASKAKADLDGRFFGGRTVTATFYDEESFAAGKLAP